MNQHYDVIVVGIGAMGSSACFHLARNKIRVLGLEQFDIAHDRGSSHGFSRMIRAAYYEEPRYVPLLLRSYQQWNDLEQLTGRKLLHTVGGAFIGPPEGMLVKNSLLAAERHNLAHEIFHADELRRHWPMFSVPQDWQALYDPMAGFLLPELSITSFAEQAIDHGGTILTGKTVRNWTADDSGVAVQTNEGTFYADHLILTAGAWSSQLLRSLSLDLTVTRQILGWVTPIDIAPFRLGNFPVWGIDSLDGGIYYGFPILPDRPGLKVAHHLPGKPFDPNEISRDSRPGDEEDFRPVLRQYIPAADGPLIELKVCMYTNTPSQHFIIDTHPESERVSIACGFSGHGFKFASVLGEILARRAMESVWDPDVDFLRIPNSARVTKC